jgi:hypothetical protein
LLAVLVYSPTTTWLAVLLPSRYTDSWLAVPPVVAVYWNDSAIPEGLESVCGLIVWSPTSITFVLPDVGVAVAVGVGEGVLVLVGVAVGVLPVDVGVLLGVGVGVLPPDEPI